LSTALQALGHDVSHNLVAELLHELGYSLQANQERREGAQHPDRDAQFRYINSEVRRFQKKEHPLTADAGGSNGSRLRVWKWELQKFADRTGLSITVCHFPPWTSKWNKIEHRLFSQP
jgi:hypothetical protein